MWIDHLLGLLPNEQSSDISFRQNEFVGALCQLHATLDDLKLAFETAITSIRKKEGLIAFDAHVSDCGCHLRAQMLFEIVRAYEKDLGSIHELEKVIEACEESLRRTRQLMQSLCWLVKFPKDSGLPSLKASRKNFLEVVNWTYTSRKQTRELKCIFYCFSLSRFKTYNERDNKDSVKIDMESAIEKMNRSIDHLSCQGYGKLGKGCRYLKLGRISKAYIKAQILLFQARLSRLSVDYLISSDKYGPEIAAYRKTSLKGIHSVPTIMQFKSLELIWFETDTPLFLAIRVCNKKFSKFIYISALVEKNMEWNFHDNFDYEKAHVVITFECESTTEKEISDIEIWNLVSSMQPKMRAIWYRFMNQHKQYPFEIDASLVENLAAYVKNDVAAQNCLTQTLSWCDWNLLPKHIFLEYPKAVVAMQKRTSGKAGSLLII